MTIVLIEDFLLKKKKEEICEFVYNLRQTAILSIKRNQEVWSKVLQGAGVGQLA